MCFITGEYIPGSTAQSLAKPYALIAGKRALNEHFYRKGVTANVELIGYRYRVHYELPKQQPLVSLIISTRNNLNNLQCCITSIFERTRYSNFEVLIVDNDSDINVKRRYLKSIKMHDRIRMLTNRRPYSFSASINSAVESSEGEIIGLLDGDIEVINSDWLSEMVGIALQVGVGAVGARVWYPNETLHNGGIVLGADTK